MFKVFTWLFTVATSVFALASAAIYYISYGLFDSNSGAAHTGAVLFWHKALLVSSLVSFGFFFIHGFLAGRALWQGKHSRAAEVSVATLIILGLFLIAHFIRS
ncbi:MAG: hypothetical protein ACEQSB_02910 [Undibacterium sp.]